MMKKNKLSKSLIEILLEKENSKTALLSCTKDGSILDGISYTELRERMRDTAVYLTKLDLKKNDTLVLAFTNSIDLLILSWTAWSMGIVTVPIDTKNDTLERCQYKIDISKAKIFLIQKTVKEYIDTQKLKRIQIETYINIPRCTKKILVKWLPSDKHLALILFTSGTTGYPKGTRLTLHNLLVNASGVCQWLNITEQDRFLVNLPLHHINSTTFCLALLLTGGSIVIPPAYSNSNFWNQIASTQTTLTSIVQLILHDQLNNESSFEKVKENILLSRIQIGSSPVIVQDMLEFEKKFHIPLYQGYGQTETALRVTGVPTDIPPLLHKKMIRENSIGIPMDWADVEITDEEGTILPADKDGEIIVRGEAVTDGYIGGEKAFRNGYFLTGDIGFFRYISGKKFFFLKGRKKEIIIKGGVNISPCAVENSLKKISSDIDQVYVIGIPDKRYGEEVGAVICWKENINIADAKMRLKNTLLSQSSHIRSYEKPRFITSIDPKDLPKTSTEKVQRSVLKEKIPFTFFESLHRK